MAQAVIRGGWADRTPVGAGSAGTERWKNSAGGLRHSLRTPTGPIASGPVRSDDLIVVDRKELIPQGRPTVSGGRRGWVNRLRRAADRTRVSRQLVGVFPCEITPVPPPPWNQGTSSGQRITDSSVSLPARGQRTPPSLSADPQAGPAGAPVSAASWDSRRPSPNNRATGTSTGAGRSSLTGDIERPTRTGAISIRWSRRSIGSQPGVLAAVVDTLGLQLQTDPKSGSPRSS